MRITDDRHDCCGASFICGFGDILNKKTCRFDLQMLTEEIKTEVEDAAVKNGHEGDRAALSILTDLQLGQGWAEILAEQGWILIARWRNRNTENWCNLFIHSASRAEAPPWLRKPLGEV